MSLEDIQIEIKKREEKKEQVFDKLVETSKIFFDEIKQIISFEKVTKTNLPAGIVGRRLSDKILFFEKTIEELSVIEKSTIKDIEKLEKAFVVLITHMRKHQENEEMSTDSQFPVFLEDIKQEFSVLKTLELELKDRYISSCQIQLKEKFNESHIDEQLKNDIKQTNDIYNIINQHIDYEGLLKLKKLNEDYGEVITVNTIAKEYKTFEHKRLEYKQQQQKNAEAREKLTASARSLTQLHKCEAKATAYLEEIEKHKKKLAIVDEESKPEIQDLIESYQEAHEIMKNETIKLKEIINEQGIKTSDEYNAKLKENQFNIARVETEMSKIEKKAKSLEEVIASIQKCRRKAISNKDT